MSSAEGKAILAAGMSRDGQLKEKERRELSRMLVKHVLSADPARKIDSTAWIEISTSIKQVFVKEPAALYYQPAISANDYQKKKNSTGLLYEAYISRRRKLRELGSIPRPSRARKRSTVLEIFAPSETPRNTLEGNKSSLLLAYFRYD